MSHRLSEAQSTDPAREKFKHDIAIGELVPAEVAREQIKQARDRLFNELRSCRERHRHCRRTGRSKRRCTETQDYAPRIRRCSTAQIATDTRDTGELDPLDLKGVQIRAEGLL